MREYKEISFRDIISLVTMEDTFMITYWDSDIGKSMTKFNGPYTRADLVACKNLYSRQVVELRTDPDGFFVVELSNKKVNDDE